LNVVGLALAVEGYNIINGWQSVDETMADSVGVAGLKPDYINGDLKFDPLGSTTTILIIAFVFIRHLNRLEAQISF